MVDDLEVEEKILEFLCEDIDQLKWPVGTGNRNEKQDIIDAVSDKLNIDKHQVGNVLDGLIEEGLLENTPVDWHVYINIYTVDRYNEKLGKELFPRKNQLEILEVLYKMEKEQSIDKWVSREILHNEYLDNLDVSGDELDRTIWYLKKTGDIDIDMSVDQFPPYTKVKLTSSGRSRYEKQL